MLFSLYTLGKLNGAEVMLAGVLVCALIYLAVCLLLRTNRKGRGVRRVLLALLISELVCDALWYVMYFPGGEYRNWGIGGVYGAALWPLLLFVAGGVVTALNEERETK